MQGYRKAGEVKFSMSEPQTMLANEAPVDLRLAPGESYKHVSYSE